MAPDSFSSKKPDLFEPAEMKLTGMMIFLAPWLFILLTACPQDALRGSVILKADGVSIYSGDLLEQFDYELNYWDVREVGEDGMEKIPGKITAKQLKTRILSEMLIPMAVVKVRYQEKIPLLMEKAKKIMEEIAPHGANFSDVAAKYSKDTNAKTGGSLGTFSRIGLPYPIPRIAFSGEEGEILGPFLSLIGCHILFVEEKTQGMVPSADTVRASHILLPYEEDRPDFIQNLLPQMIKKAVVEIINPEYASYIQLEEKEDRPG